MNLQKTQRPIKFFNPDITKKFTLTESCNQGVFSFKLNIKLNTSSSAPVPLRPLSSWPLPFPMGRDE